MQHKKSGVPYAIRLYITHAAPACTAKLLLEILNGVVPTLMVIAVAAFIDSTIALAQGTGTVSPLISNLSCMAAGYAFTQISPIFVRLANAALENALRTSLRPELLRAQTRMPFAQWESPETQDLIAHVCIDLEKRLRAILDDGIQGVHLGIQLAGMLYLLAAQIWWILPLYVLSFIPMAWAAQRGGRAIYAMERISITLTRMHYYLSSVLSSRETAAERTLFGYADAINEKFAKTHLQRSNLVTKEIAIEEIAVNFCGLLLNLLTLAAVFALLRPLGAGTLSGGLYVSLIGGLMGLARLLSGSFSRLVRDFAGHSAYMRDFARLQAAAMDADSEALEGSAPEERAQGLTFESLKIRNLRFRYTPDGEYVLRGISLALEKGQTYSLIGRNGAGKTTLTKILTGLYRDFEGEIRINGRDIRAYTPAELHGLFAVVYQDFARYEIPLRDNITLGGDSSNLEGAASLAGLDTVIGRLPNAADTPLGKLCANGADLSGGEWQRVAIARALNANAAFMILDEPTASLSPTAESALYRHFHEISRGRTCLLISHRLGSTKLADRLFVLDRGVVAEQGTHDALMAQGGIYADMFALQRSGYDA